MRTKGRRSSRCSRTASSSTTGCSTASPRKPRRPTRSCTWSTASHCSSDPIRSGACASRPGHSRSRSSRSVLAACRRTTSWCTTRPTARWRTCWSGSSPRSSPWRSACSTALPRRRTRRTCTHRRGLPASDATSPTSGHCSRATGRGRSSNPHRRAGDRGGVRRLMRLLPLLLGLSVLEGDGGWSAAAPLPEPIQELSAAVLHGKIYVAGGIDRTGQATAAAFRYDPAANHWERIADLPAPRHHMPLAVVGDTLYAVGGLAEPSFVPESTLWLYREDRNRWEPRAPLPAPRGASGVGVVSGKLVVVGGWGAGRRLTAASAIYDPATDLWHGAAPIPTPRDRLTAASDRWTRRSAMPSRRGGLTAAVLDGAIHVIGGETRGSVFANHEVYDPATDRWTTAAALPVARHGLAAAVVGGKLYVIGGGPKAGFSQTDAVDVFAP